jgi:hypothetical protein
MSHGDIKKRLKEQIKRLWLFSEDLLLAYHCSTQYTVMSTELFSNQLSTQDSLAVLAGLFHSAFLLEKKSYTDCVFVRRPTFRWLETQSSQVGDDVVETLFVILNRTLSNVAAVLIAEFDEAVQQTEKISKCQSDRIPTFPSAHRDAECLGFRWRSRELWHGWRQRWTSVLIKQHGDRRYARI